jgi:short-subunit dehydrogenase
MGIPKSKESPVVLVTGSSSGLGLALAQELVHLRKFKVVITARSGSLPILQKMFSDSERVMIRSLDITNDIEMDLLINEISHVWGGVDVLINNAGISYRSVIEDMDLESELYQLKVNYLGPMALIRLVLPTMREKGYGHIVNISSVSGMMAMPTMGSYSASKHALEGASEALWYEAKPFGISVSLMQPGFIHSNSFRNVRVSKKAKMSADLDGPYVHYYHFIGPFIERLMCLSRATPERIAKKIVNLIERDDPALWVTATQDATLFAILRKLLPKQIFHKIMFHLLPGSAAWGRRVSSTIDLNGLKSGNLNAEHTLTKRAKKRITL